MKMKQDDTANQIRQIASAMSEELGTVSERKVMALMSLPQYRDHSVVQKCKWLGIARQTWYAYQNKADFKERCAKYAKSLWGNHVFDVMDAYIRKALAGDSAVMERILETVEVLQAQSSKSSGNTQSVNIYQIKDKEAKRDEILSRFDIAVDHADDKGE